MSVKKSHIYYTIGESNKILEKELSEISNHINNYLSSKESILKKIKCGIHIRTSEELNKVNPLLPDIKHNFKGHIVVVGYKLSTLKL